MAKVDVCPCGSQQRYAQCCAPLHQRAQAAQSAVQLMRSRYSAYVMQQWDYLFDTWHPDTRPDRASLVAEAGVKWIALTIVAHHTQAQQAEVEFIARFKHYGRAAKLHERSRFVAIPDWRYVDGDIFEQE